MTTAAIEVGQLTKSFSTPSGRVHAVRGIDLTIQTGEVVALLGPNGAGKTTTLDMILGLTEPSTGSITVMGAAPRRAVIDGRVSAVLQSGGLLADLSVRETVTLIASTFGRKGEVDDVLGRAGITKLADRRVSKCSGGEQQRLRFALALIPDPELLILDEPTAGMDVTARREFWESMHAEAAAGRTVVFATHYLQEADDFADRIVLVAGGLVVAEGPTEQIRAQATGRIVSADVADPADVIKRLGELVTSTEVTGSRISIRTGDSDAVARLLLTGLGATGLEITSGSLEDAFVQLTSPQATTSDSIQSAGDAR